ncbi:MAG: BrnT family toxin [Gemmatimonadaceae bacterium]|nr:BrnT family toxin [Gemmatimonadaceae bacterium]
MVAVLCTFCLVRGEAVLPEHHLLLAGGDRCGWHAPLPEEQGAEHNRHCPRQHSHQSRTSRRRGAATRSADRRRLLRGAQRTREFRRARKAIGRQLGEGGEHGDFDVLRHRVAQRLQRRGLFAQHLGHDRLHTAADRRGVAGVDHEPELRHLLLGALDDRIVTVVFTIRTQAIRLISARYASREERRRYAETPRDG